MAVRLEEIIPKSIIIRKPLEEKLDEERTQDGTDASPNDAPSADSVMDAIALAPIPNPLSGGFDDVEGARQFFYLIGHFMQEEYGASAPKAPLTPTTKPQEEIMARSPEISAAAAQIASWLGRDCQGDMRLMGLVLDRFWSKFSIERFASPDLSSLVLIAYEEVLAESGGRKIEGLEVWPALHLRPEVLDHPLNETIAVGMAPRPVPIDSLARYPGLAEPALSPAQEGEVEVRLISIREMVRKHLQSRPAECPAILARVLGISVEETTHEELVSARLAGEMAKGGPRRFAERLWQEVRARQTDLQNGEIGATPALVGALAPQPKKGRPLWSLAPRWDALGLDEKLLWLARWIKEKGARK